MGDKVIMGTTGKRENTDEYFIRVRPIILGAGRSLFADPQSRHPLKLVDSKTFETGVIGLHYESLPLKATIP